MMAGMPGRKPVRAGDTFSMARVRAFAPRDAEMAAQWIVREYPLPAPLSLVLPALLGRLMSGETLRGVVAEHLDDAAPEPVVVGFGISGFLDERFVQDYLAAPYPYLEIDLLERCRRGRSRGAFLGYDGIAQGNAAGGLTLFPLMWLQRTADRGDREASALLTLGQQAFLRMHRGYRLARILKEAPAERAEGYLNGGFRERCRLPAGTPLRLPGRRLQREHVVFETTKAHTDAAMPGSAIWPLFAFRAPRCGFSRAEKQVLSRATEGLTDAQIAVHLGISAAAVAMRWRSIYMRVASRVPSALQETGAAPANRGRGHEKRRRVIAFLSDYPEEMRPYASP
jgi:DNA-binding CsgD family transcriptional regulator